MRGCGSCSLGLPYVLGELSELEAKRYERHLKTCAACLDEVEELRQLQSCIVADFHNESTDRHARRAARRRRLRGAMSNFVVAAAMMVATCAAFATVLPIAWHGNDMASDVRQTRAALRHALNPVSVELAYLHGATIQDMNRMGATLHHRFDLRGV